MLPGDVVASIYGSLWIYPCIYTARFGDFGRAVGAILWVLLYLRGEMVCHRCSIAALAALAELVFGIFWGRNAHFVGKITATSAYPFWDFEDAAEHFMQLLAINLPSSYTPDRWCLLLDTHTYMMMLVSSLLIWTYTCLWLSAPI